MKRFFDIVFSVILLIVSSPFIILSLFFVWSEDKSNPFYLALRVGKKGKLFRMIKIRTMVKNASLSGVDSTSADDERITKVGKQIRKYKLDELTQLINILKGEMSLVGPRPNVIRDVNIYTSIERRLLEIKPGLTDFSSIVFSDESEILRNKFDPDIVYNQLIRPWKSRLGLFYIDKNNIFVDIYLIFITFIGIFSRKISLNLLVRFLNFLKAPKNLIKIASRKNDLVPSTPPGSDMIVTTRDY